jgi:rhodanese-related sulfurtransferase/rubrerythrin
VKITDVFTSIDKVSVKEAKEMLAEKKESDLALVDVREPEEYREGHLPGAQLLPLSEILDRLKELDASKTTITYCRRGNRSRSAAALMKTHGFSSIYSMDGGIEAWNGLVATGQYESGMFLIEGEKTAEAMVALALALEEGTRIFYEKTRDVFPDETEKQIFELLIKAEEKHKSMLHGTLRNMKKNDITEETVKGSPEGYMESGITVKEAIDWLMQEKRKLNEVLEFSMQIETNSLDLYSKISRRVDDQESREVFFTLIRDEKAHLSRLGKLLGSRIKKR